MQLLQGAILSMRRSHNQDCHKAAAAKDKEFRPNKRRKRRQDFHRHASFHSLFFTAFLHPSFLLTQTDLTTIRIQRGTTTRNRIAGTLLECYNLASNTSLASCLLPAMIITHKKPSPKIKSKQNKTKLSSSSSSYRVILPSKQASGKKLDTIWRALHHRHTFSSSQDHQETNCDEPKPDQKKNKRNLLKSKEPARKKTLEKKSRKIQEKNKIEA